MLTWTSIARRKPLPLTPKRKAIEKRLGRPLHIQMREKFLNNSTQEKVAKELGLDPATVRYYIKKWNLPYDKKAARRTTRSKWDHLEVCVCVLCKHRLCQDARKAHSLGRCTLRCFEFLGKFTGGGG